MKTCGVCGGSFEAKTNGRYCSDTCRATARRGNHHKRLTAKMCSVCQSEFLGKKSEVRCGGCKDKPVRKEWRTFERRIVCKNCDTEMSTEIVCVTNTNEIAMGICDACRAANLATSSARLSANNPMRCPATAAKVTATRRVLFQTDAEYRARMIHRGQNLSRFRTPMTKEARQQASARMKASNPMHDADVAARATSSRLSKGYVTPKGKNHWLWKGNRDRAQVIRVRLYPVWTLKHLERSGFACEECNTSKVRLEVHHEAQSFRDCLTHFLNGRDIADLNDDEFEFLAQDVIRAHEAIDGRVVCVPCHRLIDPRRR